MSPMPQIANEATSSSIRTLTTQEPARLRMVLSMGLAVDSGAGRESAPNVSGRSEADKLLREGGKPVIGMVESLRPAGRRVAPDRATDGLCHSCRHRQLEDERPAGRRRGPGPGSARAAAGATPSRDLGRVPAGDPAQPDR